MHKIRIEIDTNMTKIVLVEKTGSLKTLNIKDFAENTLYKKAGLKVGEGFVLQHTWGADSGLDQSIKLYAKKTGRAGQENKYDFPPPVDEMLFFGPCILVGSDLNTGNPVDLEEDDWEEIYDFLFGGFEDLNSDESDDEDDIDTDDEIDAIQKKTGAVVKQTKQGYAKDGFIVDDEESEEDFDEDSSESDDATPPKKLLVKGRLPKSKQPEMIQAVDNNLTIDDCESELSEESYV